MSFSISSPLSDQELARLGYELVRNLSPKQIEILCLIIEQAKEACQDEEYFPHCSTQFFQEPKKPNPYPYLSDKEKIVYICHLAGLGCTRMSAFSKYTERHISRLYIEACEKVAAKGG